MEKKTEISKKDLQIIELPQREAMGWLARLFLGHGGTGVRVKI